MMFDNVMKVWMKIVLYPVMAALVWSIINIILMVGVAGIRYVKNITI